MLALLYAESRSQCYNLIRSFMDSVMPNNVDCSYLGFFIIFALGLITVKFVKTFSSLFSTHMTETTASELYERESSTIFQTYRRLPMAAAHAEGCRIFDTEGRSYLDFLSGIAVNALGHSHPRIVAAVTEQAAKYMHLSNFFYQEPQIRLAEMLRDATGYERTFFSNSGAESFEGAIKLARLWGSTRGKTDMIGFSGGFHGRTYGSLSLMDKPIYKDGMGPFLPNMQVVPFNDVEALHAAITESTCGVALEFLQGEGGIVSATPEFVAAIEELRLQFGFLLIADEVQAGVGRTGRFFGFEHLGIHPDVVVMAKGLGGGLPLGAIITSNDIAALLQRGMHGTTYGGNALACAAGAVVIEEVQNGVMENARQQGQYLRGLLEEIHRDFPSRVKEVRGIGLMQGVALTAEAPDFVAAMLRRGIVSNITAGSVVRVLPPLIVTQSEINEFIAAMRNVLAETSGSAN